MTSFLDIAPRSRARALLDHVANVLQEVRPLVERQSQEHASWADTLARVDSALAAVDDLSADEMGRATK